MLAMLLKHLTDEHGWKNPDASDEDLHAEASRLIKAGAMTSEKFVELVTPSSSPLDRLTENIVKALDQKGGAGIMTTGRVDVKRASASYSDTKTAVVYTKRHGEEKAGKPVMFRGEEMNLPSEREKALAGAHLMMRIAKQAKMDNRLPQHVQDLYQEGLRVLKFAGDAPALSGGSGLFQYQGERLLEEHIKTIFGDNTSGGVNMIPQVLEDNIIMTKVLENELTPHVDIVSIPKGASIDTTSMTHVTVASGTNEATGAISPQSTSSLISKVNSPVFVHQGAIELGRDFVSDTPLAVMDALMQSYNKQNGKYLDYCIAIGDGTTQPLGLFTISGPTTVASQNGSSGVFTVLDFENMLKGMGKEYRTNSPSVRWVSNDTTYWRARGVPVSTTDARRVFGQNYEDYALAGRPWSIQNSIGNTKLGFGDLKQYRLWNRPGVEVQVEQSGRTLVLANSILVVFRSRWAGRLLDTSAFVKMTTAPR